MLHDPPVTTEEGRPDSSVSINEAQSSSSFPTSLLLLPTLKFLGLALQPLVLPDSQ